MEEEAASNLDKRPLSPEPSPRVGPSSPKRLRLDSDLPDTEVAKNLGGPQIVPETPQPSGSKPPRTSKKSDKYKSAKGRRRGSRPDGEEEEHADSSEPKALRLPKRQTALLIGFCGAGYSGMQYQPTVSKTIEGTLFNVLVNIGCVSKDNADDPVKVNFNRAARTDAGVHAAGNLVSMKMITTIPGIPNVVERINEELPPEIRLWGTVRVQNSFQARGTCDSRKYTYLFPSYLLLPPKPGSGLSKTFLSQLPEGSNAPSHPFWPSECLDSSKEDDLLRKRAWRVDEAAMTTLRAVAQKYIGTHNFHNFTVGKEFKDKSCSRHMLKIEIADPVVHGETEWISVLIHGQSFMLHQIRKMIAALILACRTGTPSDIISDMFGPRVLFIPKMPALGLLLEYPIFDSYNRRVEKANGAHKPGDLEYKAPIDFDIHKEAMERFKQEHVYSGMRRDEDKHGIFDAWIRSVDSYAGNDLAWLNPQGSIPDRAVIKKGVRRENPFRERKSFNATSYSDALGKKVADAEADSDADEEDEEKLDKKALAEMEG